MQLNIFLTQNELFTKISLHLLILFKGKNAFSGEFVFIVFIETNGLSNSTQLN